MPTLTVASHSLCQRPDPDGVGTLLGARVPAEQPTAYQEHDKGHAPQHGCVHGSPSLGGVSAGYGRLPHRLAYHRTPLKSLRIPPGLS